MPNTLDERIICLLKENSRISFADIGRQIQLSPSSVRERVIRMEELGIIKKYSLVVDQTKLGNKLEAFILIKMFFGKLKTFLSIVNEIKEIEQCYRITGSQNVQLKVILKDQIHLQKLLDNLMNYGDTSTHLILSEVINNQ